MACSPTSESTTFVMLKPSFRTTIGRTKISRMTDEIENVRSCPHSGIGMPTPTMSATRNAPTAKNPMCAVVAKNSIVSSRNATRTQTHQAIFVRGEVTTLRPGCAGVAPDFADERPAFRRRYCNSLSTLFAMAGISFTSSAVPRVMMTRMIFRPPGSSMYAAS